MAILQALQQTSSPITGSSSSAVSPENFIKCLKKFYHHWKEDKSNLWESSSAIAVATPPLSDDIRYKKSLALSMWFFGRELPETIMLFTDRQIHVMCKQKGCDVLKPLKIHVSKAVSVDIVLHSLAKGDNGSSLMDDILRAVCSHSESKSVVIGHLAREKPQGKVLEAWSEKLNGSGLRLSDVSSGISDLLAVKDATEIMYVKKAAYLTASVVRKYVVSKLEKIIADERKVPHSKLTDLTQKILLSPLKVDVKLKAENVDICYPPIFQSGGKYDLRPSASSNSDDLYYDSGSLIVCALGAKYSSYCSNVARTFLIDCDGEKCNAYKVLRQAHDAAIAALKPGSKVSDSYQAAVSVVRDKAPELVPFLTKSAGTGIGLEFRETWLSLNEKNDRILKEGMVFNVSLGFQNLLEKNSDYKNKEYSLWLADTVLVCKEKPHVLTAFVSKADDDAFYSFDEEKAESPSVKLSLNAQVMVPEKPVLKEELMLPLKENLRSRSRTAKEDLRKQLQAEILQKRTAVTAMNSNASNQKSLEGRGLRAVGELVAYKKASDIPCSNLSEIQVDKQNEAILLPIYGVIVPFHVCTVKKAEIRGDSSRVFVCITFNVPGTASNLQDPSLKTNANRIFLKAATFISKDRKHAEEVIQLTRTIQRGVTERARRASLVSQERLQLCAGMTRDRIQLMDLWIRPTFAGRGRKAPGTLVVHVNGFQYSASKSEKVDIMFCNIKHAFFQPAVREMITLLHFHLYNDIMVGNKKTRDVQFYIEVMDTVESVGLSRRLAWDPDEIEEEKRERERRKGINMQFEVFVKRVNSIWSQPKFDQLSLQFETPSQKHGFNGVHGRSTCFIVPAPSCLVQLVESPFLVTSLREVDIVCLERVALGQKSFDMVFVFQDLSRDVVRIEVIPMTSYEEIKDWLSQSNMKYYESKLNLSWRKVLKQIMNDPELDGKNRWEFLNPDASDSGSESSETEDEQYEPSDADSCSESDDEDSGSESVVDSSQDDDAMDGSEDDDGDAAESWDEMERKAREADMEMGSESASEDERQRRREKALAKSRRPNHPQAKGSAQKRQRTN
uniref:FACT complex subunit n=1 Tax=Leersia perrieri TaxID=77586 RepID=A0A0D9XZ22_9ORYZ